MIDKVVEAADTTNSKKSCLGYSYDSSTCKLNYGVQIAAAAVGAGTCKIRNRSVKTNLDTAFTKLLVQVNAIAQSITIGLPTKSGSAQKTYDDA